MSNSKRHAIRPVCGPETLLFGIGNCGRSDDGLGWAFLDRVQQEPSFGARVEYRYQLQVEDAALAAQADRVIFIDSYRDHLPDGVRWQACEPSEDFEFTTHVLPPRAVMHFCSELYGRQPEAWLLMIQGDRWDLHNGLSEAATARLETALSLFRDQFA